MNATGSHPKRIGYRIFVLVVLALAVVAFAEPTGVQAQGEHVVYLPAFHVASAGTTSATGSEDAIDTSEWRRYTSEAGGYSLLLPVGWKVEESQDRPKGTLSISPPVYDYQDSVFIRYLQYEKYESDELIPWLEQYYGTVLAGLVQEEKVFSTTSFPVEGAEEGSEQAAFRSKHFDNGKGYFIANGRLVLIVVTNSTSDRSDELIRAIAESIEFGDGSSTSIEQILDTKNPAGANLQDYLDWQRIRSDAIAALNKRMQTGETPDELLQDDAVRERYEMLLERKAYDIEQADWLREKLEELYPGYDQYAQSDDP